jgi:hypothetical protein
MTRLKVPQHCKSKHTPECRPCRSTFPTWEELEEHWQTAEAHPRCNKCSMGFEEYRTYVKVCVYS